MTWPYAQIRHLASLGTGHTPSRSVPEYWENCTIPWLTLADVHQLRDGTETTVEDTSEQISALGVANSSAVPHPKGTVAMSRTASVGFTCILGTRMATSQDFVTWTCSEKLDNRYLLWALRGERAQILSRMQGSTHKTIYMPDLEDLRIPLPPLAEQRAIADYLDAETARIDALIAKKQQLIHLLEERLQREIDQWCSGPDVTLRRVVSDFVDYRGATPDKTDSGIPLITATHIKKGVFDHSLDPVFVSESTYATWMRRGFPAHGDVLLTMEAPLGEVAQIVDEKVALAQRLMLIKTIDDRCSANYLAFALRTSLVQDRLRAHSTGSTASGIKADRLKGLPIPILPREDQDEAVGAIRALEQSTSSVSACLGQQLLLLRERRQAVITAAVTGELSVVAGVEDVN